MKSLDGRNNVKIYNLSAGKTLPDWLTERKRRKLGKRDVDIRRRIELIQDFNMPDVSNCIRVSPDSQYILAAGTYKPRVKCFEVSALSLKFERCFDAEVINFEVLSEDYSKLVFLQQDRYIEFHSQGGRWFRNRIPKFGRDLAYHYPSCDLYIGASGSEIYRLNLQQGKFLNSLQTDSTGINKCLFNPVHYLFTCGTEDGRIETWDPRSRHRVGVLDCALHMIKENIQISAYKSAKDLAVTSLAYNDGLMLGVGTQTGQILLYDIRSDKPVLVKDHMDGFPIKDLEFHSAHSTYGMVFSLSSNALKIWHKDTGKPHTSIESDVKFNDLCSIPGSGMVFLATEDPKMQIYFLPSLGPAPKWCGHLDALIEELEEEEAPPAYDDYKFVTDKELNRLGLDSLIGTNILRAVMHGYYLDVRLYNRAKQAANILDKDHLLKKTVKQKIAQQNERKIVISEKLQKAAPDVNKEPFMALKEEAQKGTGEKSELAKDLLEDPRFGAMFTKTEFDVNKETEIYSIVQPLTRKGENRFKRLDDDTDDEEEEREPQAIAASTGERDSSSSESDSIVSSDTEEEEEEEEEEEKDPATKQKPRKEVEERKLRAGLKPATGGNSVPLTRRRVDHPATEEGPVPVAERGAELVSGDTFEQLKPSWEHRKEMSLADRLQEEEWGRADDGEEAPHEKGRGSRQMEVTFGEASSQKFERLRQQQQEHHRERKKGVRRTNNLRGKIRMNKQL